MSNTRLAILGGGNMGRALIGGLLRQGTRPEHIQVGETQEAARESLARDFGVAATADNLVAAQSATLIVLAVKPHQVGAALTALRPLLERDRPLVVSVAAGLRIAALESWCGAGVPIVRAIPNRPALVGAGATGLCAPAHVTQSSRGQAERLMRAVGEVVWLEREDDLDIVTALSGSGPAYFFLLAELMMRSGIGLGLDPAVARRLAVATLHGAGQLAYSSADDLARMRADVTSKGGTTEAALRVLEAGDLPGLMARALEAAAHRSRELAEQYGVQS